MAGAAPPSSLLTVGSASSGCGMRGSSGSWIWASSPAAVRGASSCGGRVPPSMRGGYPGRRPEPGRHAEIGRPADALRSPDGLRSRSDSRRCSASIRSADCALAAPGDACGSARADHRGATGARSTRERNRRRQLGQGPGAAGGDSGRRLAVLLGMRGLLSSATARSDTTTVLIRCRTMACGSILDGGFVNSGGHPSVARSSAGPRRVSIVDGGTSALVTKGISAKTPSIGTGAGLAAITCSRCPGPGPATLSHLAGQPGQCHADRIRHNQLARVEPLIL